MRELDERRVRVRTRDKRRRLIRRRLHPARFFLQPGGDVPESPQLLLGQRYLRLQQFIRWGNVLRKRFIRGRHLRRFCYSAFLRLGLLLEREQLRAQRKSTPAFFLFASVGNQPCADERPAATERTSAQQSATGKRAPSRAPAQREHPRTQPVSPWLSNQIFFYSEVLYGSDANDIIYLWEVSPSGVAVNP